MGNCVGHDVDRQQHCHLILRRPTGRTIKMCNVRGSDTIQYIKSRIGKSYNSISLPDSGIELKDSHTLASYGLPREDILLQLIPQWMSYRPSVIQLLVHLVPQMLPPIGAIVACYLQTIPSDFQITITVSRGIDPPYLGSYESDRYQWQRPFIACENVVMCQKSFHGQSITSLVCPFCFKYLSWKNSGCPEHEQESHLTPTVDELLPPPTDGGVVPESFNFCNECLQIALCREQFYSYRHK